MGSAAFNHLLKPLPQMIKTHCVTIKVQPQNPVFLPSGKPLMGGKQSIDLNFIMEAISMYSALCLLPWKAEK